YDVGESERPGHGQVVGLHARRGARGGPVAHSDRRSLTFRVVAGTGLHARYPCASARVGGECMSTLLLLTGALQPSAEVLPGLALRGHQVKTRPAEGSALIDAPNADLILVDGRQELAHARDLCRLLRTTGTDCPVLLVVTEGGLAVVAHDWGMDDVVLHTCGPAELEARIRLSIGRLHAARNEDQGDAHVIRTGEVVVDDATYTATIGSR